MKLNWKERETTQIVATLGSLCCGALCFARGRMQILDRKHRHSRGAAVVVVVVQRRGRKGLAQYSQRTRALRLSCHIMRRCHL